MTNQDPIAGQGVVGSRPTSPANITEFSRHRLPSCSGIPLGSQHQPGQPRMNFFWGKVGQLVCVEFTKQNRGKHEYSWETKSYGCKIGHCVICIVSSSADVFIGIEIHVIGQGIDKPARVARSWSPRSLPDLGFKFSGWFLNGPWRTGGITKIRRCGNFTN